MEQLWQVQLRSGGHFWDWPGWLVPAPGREEALKLAREAGEALGREGVLNVRPCGEE